ncbi:hypothetical protein A3Q56_06200, partial [Intoshia linei]
MFESIFSNELFINVKNNEIYSLLTPQIAELRDMCYDAYVCGNEVQRVRVESLFTNDNCMETCKKCQFLLEQPH